MSPYPAHHHAQTELTQPYSDELISGAFLNLPSRELRDYYRVIKHPVCLRGLQKQIRGVKGREKPTGHTLLKSWQAFDEESSYIWNNAREYNEDGSVISELATELEVGSISCQNDSWLTSRSHTSGADLPKPNAWCKSHPNQR